MDVEKSVKKNLQPLIDKLDLRIVVDGTTTLEKVLETGFKNQMQTGSVKRSTR